MLKIDNTNPTPYLLLELLRRWTSRSAVAIAGIF